ncbi:class A sortase [Lacticaseibacillus brantae]|uniref:Sortase A n=1 Tax=Lacticaseibacillus brantae DSM 23927 TaxID=1423727 RepID=A0A0R2AZQ1_9LACO|nr:class A sortase [Lacticaseibacillus brantae]KRM72346.1 sortase A [Lacticaseibacillus brantae DSM 23927]
MTKTSRTKRWVIRIILMLGVMVGLALVFNEQIKIFVIQQLSSRTVEKLDGSDIQRNTKRKASFDFKAVKALDVGTVAHAAVTNNPNAIGQIAIPDVGMRLPILKGLANDNLAQGAGTMKPTQVMGQGNYALAGHYMTNQGVLFSPLKGVKTGDFVYLTDKTKVYTYQVTLKKVVYEDQVQWIDDVSGKQLLTLVTCASPTEGETDRIIVRATLTKVAKATTKTLSVF